MIGLLDCILTLARGRAGNGFASDYNLLFHSGFGLKFEPQGIPSGHSKVRRHKGSIEEGRQNRVAVPAAFLTCWSEDMERLYDS